MQNSQQQTASGNLIDSSHVEGTKVFDPSGKDIGSIKRMVIEKVGGRVVYAVASFGGFLGLGGSDRPAIGSLQIRRAGKAMPP